MLARYLARAKAIWRKACRAAQICEAVVEINLGTLMALLGVATLVMSVLGSFHTVYFGPLVGLGLLAFGVWFGIVSGVKGLLKLGSSR